MLSTELEYCLNDAFQRAREERHEFITVEHLLLALLDTPTVIETLKACGTDLARLRRELKEFIEGATPRLRGEEEEATEVQPTLGFQRVLQRAVFHVQSSGRKEVTPINVLVAIFSEKQSQAVYLLGKTPIDGSKKSANDPAFNMVAQLFAAKLNYASGAQQCNAASQAMTDAQTLLVAISFNGLTHTTLTSTQAAQLNAIAGILDKYNNNTLVC